MIHIHVWIKVNMRSKSAPDLVKIGREIIRWTVRMKLLHHCYWTSMKQDSAGEKASWKLTVEFSVYTLTSMYLHWVSLWHQPQWPGVNKVAWMVTVNWTLLNTCIFCQIVLYALYIPLSLFLLLILLLPWHRSKEEFWGNQCTVKSDYMNSIFCISLSVSFSEEQYKESTVDI